MSHTINSEFVARIARRGLGLAALLALFFAGAAVSRAQSNVMPAATPTTKPSAASAKDPSSPAAKGSSLPAAKPAADVETEAATTSNAYASPVEKAPAKGQHEGITIHGHWAIEVKNPDGTRVSHQEFENSLVQPSGAQDLTLLLIGADVAGGYRVSLATNGNPVNGPCAENDGFITACTLEGSLISPTPTSFADGTNGCGGSTITAAGPCFPLSITTVAGVEAPTGLVLSGTAAPTSTTVPITDVYLAPLLCPVGGNPASTTTGGVSPTACAQGSVSVWSYLTHAGLQSPVQITTVGQFVTVTVTISFQ
jgi:hypothetical protein